MPQRYYEVDLKLMQTGGDLVDESDVDRQERENVDDRAQLEGPVK